MEDQIEMSTREISSPNIIRPTFSFGDVHRETSTNSSWTPANIAMAKYSARERSFDYWPKQLVQKPDQFIKSGFYYTGRGDVVCCFFCNLTLKNWTSTDIVDNEHMRYSRWCKFLLMCCSN